MIDWQKSGGTPYTDLCAQGEAAMEGTTKGPWEFIPAGNRPDVFQKGRWVDGYICGVESQNFAADAAFIAWARNNVPALISAIRELEAQKRDLALDVLAASGQAQDAYEAQLAAEAKLAEVEKERDEANEWADETLELLERVGADRKNLWARIEAAEATVATLTAQVEAIRGAAEEVLRISDRDHQAWHRLRAEIAKIKETAK